MAAYRQHRLNGLQIPAGPPDSCSIAAVHALPCGWLQPCRKDAVRCSAGHSIHPRIVHVHLHCNIVSTERGKQ